MKKNRVPEKRTRKSRALEELRNMPDNYSWHDCEGVPKDVVGRAKWVLRNTYSYVYRPAGCRQKIYDARLEAVTRELIAEIESLRNAITTDDLVL